jgi:hypothetical protein
MAHVIILYPPYSTDSRDSIPGNENNDKVATQTLITNLATLHHVNSTEYKTRDVVASTLTIATHYNASLRDDSLSGGREISFPFQKFKPL